LHGYEEEGHRMGISKYLPLGSLSWEFIGWEKLSGGENVTLNKGVE